MSYVIRRSGREVSALWLPCQGLPLSLPMVSGGGMVTSEDRDVRKGLQEGKHMQGYPCSPSVVVTDVTL